MNAKPDRQSARRTLRILGILQGNTFSGLSLKQIAEALKTSPPNAYRDLETMREEGWVERHPADNERWRLSPKPIQLSRAHDLEFQRLRAQVNDLDQRYTREP